MPNAGRFFAAVEAAADERDFPCEVYLASPTYSASWTFDDCDDIDELLDLLRSVWGRDGGILQRVAEDDEAWIEFTRADDDSYEDDDTPATVWCPLYEATTADEGHFSASNVSDVEPAPKCLRLWRLFSYLLPRKTRERVFEPAYQELLEDYLTTRGKYRTRWAKRWLAFCYTFRTGLMVADCMRALLADKALAFLARIVPEPVKRWWLSK